MTPEELRLLLQKTSLSYDDFLPNVIDFARNKDPEELEAFFLSCWENVAAPIDLVLLTAIRLLAEGEEGLVEYLCQRAKPGHFLNCPYSATLALLKFKKLEIDAGASLLRQSIRLYIEIVKQDPSQKFLNVSLLLQSAFFLESAEFPMPLPLKDPSMQVLYSKPYKETPYTCCISCDILYFEHYAHSFITSFREKCGPINIFLLLVNPDKKTLARARDYEGITVAQTFYDGRWLAEFSASARFIVGGKILKHTKTPTLFMDIDSDFPEKSRDILLALSQHPLALCHTKNFFPYLHISAALLAAHPTEKAYNFFSLAKKFILTDLMREGPLWGLDQIALYRAAVVGNEKKWSIPDINSILPDTVMPDFFLRKKGVIKLEERQKKRSNMSYFYFGMRDNGQLRFLPANLLKNSYVLR